MNKETEALTKLRESVSETMEELPYRIDPCTLCREQGNGEYCRGCCYWYSSKFVLK